LLKQGKSLGKAMGDWQGKTYAFAKVISTNAQPSSKTPKCTTKFKNTQMHNQVQNHPNAQPSSKTPKCTTKFKNTQMHNQVQKHPNAQPSSKTGRKIWRLCYPSGTPWEGGTEQTKTKKRGLGGKLNALATALIFTSA
jgi:predicted sulfurtransferase